jgi:hypothetical protein
LQKSGDAVDGDPVAFLRQYSADKTSLVVKNLDGGIADRQRWKGAGLIRRKIIFSDERTEESKERFLRSRYEITVTFLLFRYGSLCRP